MWCSYNAHEILECHCVTLIHRLGCKCSNRINWHTECSIKKSLLYPHVHHDNLHPLKCSWCQINTCSCSTVHSFVILPIPSLYSMVLCLLFMIINCCPVLHFKSISMQPWHIHNYSTDQFLIDFIRIFTANLSHIHLIDKEIPQRNSIVLTISFQKL